MKILQTNVGRAYAAQDMAYATAKQLGIDVLIVSEPNKKRVVGKDWLKDNRTNVSVLFLTKKLGIIGHKLQNGHLEINLKNFTIICCYISPNISLPDYKEEVDIIMDKVNQKEFIILGDINAKATEWGSPVTDEKGEYWMEWISIKKYDSA